MRETLLEHSGAGGVLADFAPVHAAIRHELLVEQIGAFTRFALRELQEVVEQVLQDQVTSPDQEPPAARPAAPPGEPEP
jgi:hypothetical protein